MIYLVYQVMKYLIKVVKKLEGRINQENQEEYGNEKKNKYQGKLKDRPEDIGRAKDEKFLPGKLKNPFDGQGKPGDRDGHIPTKY